MRRMEIEACQGWEGHIGALQQNVSRPGLDKCVANEGNVQAVERAAASPSGARAQHGRERRLAAWEVR